MGGLTFQNVWKLVCLFILLKELSALVNECFFSSRYSCQRDFTELSRQDKTIQTKNEIYVICDSASHRSRPV